MKIGFVHTSPTHIERFDALVAELAPECDVITVVDAALLDRARSHGLDDLILIGGVADRLAELADADVVVCTCSTIGGLAEEVGAAADVHVRRVDRAMAEIAVGIGGRVAVVAALPDTVRPTVDLLEELATAAGTEIAIEVIDVSDSWPAFERGDAAAYEAAIVEAVVACGPGVDVVVLAQASMVGVADRPEIDGLPTPVLTSPRPAVAAALGVTR